MQYSLRNSDFDIPRFEAVCFAGKAMCHCVLNNFKQKIRKIDLSSLIKINSNCCTFCDGHYTLYLYTLFDSFIIDYNNSIHIIIHYIPN